MTYSEETPVQTKPIQKRNPAPKYRSLHTQAKWSGKKDQPYDPREGVGNALALRTKVGILNRSVANVSIFDQSFTIERNKARSTAITMVRDGTNL